MKTIILLASSRSQGNTAQLASYFTQKLDARLLDLTLFNIKPFDYNGNYNDDFQSVIDTLLSYDRIIFATPMYWYAASAQMKAFLDRISDLLNTSNDKGKALRGKYCGLLATGGNDLPPECFEQVFKLTFNYLGMHYQGMMYCGCAKTLELDRYKSKLKHYTQQLDPLITI